MLNRSLGINIVENPITDSVFCRQDDIGDSFNPIPPNGFLLLNNSGFQLLNGTPFLLLQ